MKYSQHLEILDDLLRHLKDNDSQIEEITVYWVSLKNNLPLDPYLEKLIKDGYLGKYPSHFYHLTLEGSILIETGGYVEMEKSKVSLTVRVEKNEARVRKATVFAAVFGGLLLLWEILKYLLENTDCMKL